MDNKEEQKKQGVVEAQKNPTKFEVFKLRIKTWWFYTKENFVLKKQYYNENYQAGIAKARYEKLQADVQYVTLLNNIRKSEERAASKVENKEQTKSNNGKFKFKK